MRKVLENLKIPYERWAPRHKELMRPRDVPWLRHLWEVWCELGKRRRSGMNGAEPIGFDQVVYWQQLYNRHLELWEIQAVFAIEDEWYRIVNKIAKDDGEENVG